MVRKVVAIALIAGMALGLSGCILRRAEGSAPRTEERDVASSFDTIDFEGWGELVIKEGEDYEVEVSGSRDMLDRLRTDVRGDTLRIYQESNTQIYFFGIPNDELKVTVTLPGLRGLELDGAGQVTLDGIESESLEIELGGAGDVSGDVDVDELAIVLSGAGTVALEGRADVQDIELSGLGSFDGSELEGRDGSVRMSGAGSATMWVTQALEVDLSGLGTVEYYGDPEVDVKRMDGAGTIDSLGDK